MDRKPINPDDLPSRGKRAEELRRVKRLKGRRNLTNFESLPVTTQVHAIQCLRSTLNRGRDGPKYFLKDFRQVLLADAYGGYNGVVAGNEIGVPILGAHEEKSD